MDLQRLASNLVSNFSTPALNNRDQHLDASLLLLSDLCFRMPFRTIHCRCCATTERAHCLDLATHFQQHPSNIGVINNRDARSVSLTDRPTLNPLLRISQCLLIGPIGNPVTFNANRMARSIHHNKHVLQTAMLLPYQVSHGTLIPTIGHQRCWAAMNPQFMLQGHAVHVVSGSSFPGRVRNKLRHDKK